MAGEERTLCQVASYARSIAFPILSISTAPVPHIHYNLRAHMPPSNTQQQCQPANEADDWSDDDELEAIWVDPIATVEATLEDYEVERKAIRVAIDTSPNMTEEELLAMARRFENLANAVVSNSVHVRLLTILNRGSATLWGHGAPCCQRPHPFCIL